MGSAAMAEGDKMWRTAVEVGMETVAVQGVIPPWLNGRYYRVGPGKFDFDNYSVTHWLDGYAMVSQFEIDAEQQCVKFRSKFLKSDAYQRAVKNQRPAVAEFASPAFNTESKKSFFSKLLPQIVPETTDNTNHAFVTFDHCNNGAVNSPLFTVNGAGMMNSIDPVTLECLTQVEPSSTFGVNMCTAHPLTDAVTGDSYNVGFSLVLTGLKYNLFRIPPITRSTEVKGQLQQAKILCSIPTQWTASMSFLHSFGMTPRYIVFVEQPLVVSLSKMLNSSVRGKSEAFKDWLEWRSDAENRFYVIEKSTGKLLNKSLPITSSEPFFFFHVINCYEDLESNELVLDLSTYENAEVLLGDSNILSRVRDPERFRGHDDDELLERSPKNKRFRIPLASLGIDLRVDNGAGAMAAGVPKNRPLVLSPCLIQSHGGLELATINRSWQGKPYRYFYASGLLTQGVFRNAVVKVSVIDGEVKEFRGSDQYIFGEPIFVGDKSKSLNRSSEEDSGVLIVPMTDLRPTEPDMLFFLDASRMTEIGRAVFQNWVPPALHGIFVLKE